MNLLIVEDDSGVREMLIRSLRETQYLIDMAVSWGQMEVFLEQKDYQILLLDLGLPDSSTDITLSKIRPLKMEHPEMAICVITGHPAHTKESALKAGADDFVHKTDLMRPPGLIQILSNLISKVGSSSKKMTDQINLAADATHHVIREMNE